MTLAFFCLASLSLLGKLEETVSQKDRVDWIEWIYAQQVHPDSHNPSASQHLCGFKGSPWAGHAFDPLVVWAHDWLFLFVSFSN